MIENSQILDSETCLILLWLWVCPTSYCERYVMLHPPNTTYSNEWNHAPLTLLCCDSVSTTELKPGTKEPLILMLLASHWLLFMGKK